MRNRHIITPLGIAQHPLFHHPTLLAQHPLGRVRQRAQDNFVKLFNLGLDVLVSKVGVVQVLSLPTGPEGDFDGGGARVDGDQFGIEADLYVSSVLVVPHISSPAEMERMLPDTAAASLVRIHNMQRKTYLDALPFHILLPGRVKLGALGKHHHRRQVAAQTMLINLVPHPIRRARVQALHHHRGKIRGRVAGTQKEGEGR